ncbi:3-ketoacyl-ACP reductase [Mesorhizobium sp. YM1C-6-2]|uniref:3-ketoacyl-ACP reductase n=1 Tax=Mesorhizobium sp. YM1C-6-2 TaxID=1827501 RepID=UPI000EF1809C|nr:3-ketoacyl-ACP reductase [Mesorhizobium sp. YM1C-6-2]RLP24850.1 3-ketoacyl-ACP reductase [Mesorhizobium sp. YM1C-6-2]
MTRRAAIVTGANRGIGLAIAEILAASGFDILAADLAPAPSDELQAGVERNNGRLAYKAFDLGDLSTHAGVLETAGKEFGSIDCLVNNAGMASPVRGDLLELTPENFDRVLDVNLRGTIFLSQTVARAMLAAPVKPGRSIITITSVSAEFASPERPDYCVSKAGLSMWVKNLALRLAADGIAVFEVRPGIVRTDMTAAVADKYDGLIGEGLVPARRWGQAADVGLAVATLAAGTLGFATGSILNVDGALSVRRL